MPRLPADVIGSAYRDGSCWELLEDLTDIGNRMAGHEGEREGAERLLERFAELDLRDPRLEEFEINGWWRDQARLQVAGDSLHHPHEVIALPGSPAGSADAELIDVGHGLRPTIEAANVDGRIVLARSDSPPGESYVHRMVKYAAAVQGGAAGFIYANHVPGCLPPTGDIAYHARPAPVPGVGVSAEVGATLARQCESGNPTATVTTACRTEPTTSMNAQAELGPDTDEIVFVTAHVDAHDIATGAGDNGAGCALLAETARLVAEASEELDTTVRFVALGAEECGLFGAYHVADTIPNDRIRCVLNIDGVGASREPRLSTNGFTDVAAAIETAAARFDATVETSDTVSPHADDWAFCERGIPAVQFASVREATGRGWGHTHADTLDKLDPRDLRELAIILAEAIIEVAGADRAFKPKQPDEIREALDENDELELRVGDRWHFE